MDFSKWKDSVIHMIMKISQYTFGIYLVHWYFVNYLVYESSVNQYSLSFRTVGAVLIFLISLVCVWVLRKIKIMRYILP